MENWDGSCVVIGKYAAVGSFDPYVFDVGCLTVIRLDEVILFVSRVAAGLASRLCFSLKHAIRGWIPRQRQHTCNFSHCPLHTVPSLNRRHICCRESWGLTLLAKQDIHNRISGSPI